MVMSARNVVIYNRNKPIYIYGMDVYTWFCTVVFTTLLKYVNLSFGFFVSVLNICFMSLRSDGKLKLSMPY